MIVVAAFAACTGTYLLYSALVLGHRQLLSRRLRQPLRRRDMSDWLVQAGMIDVRPIEFASVEIAVLLLVTSSAWIVFGAAIPALFAGGCAAVAPIALYRSRRRTLRDEARAAWPFIIEEIRLLTGSLGRSIPVGVLEAGRKAPTAPMRAAFAAANREWLLTTDFGRACATLKELLADVTADAVCETLLVAHEVGGSDLERRLAALIEDRRVDLRHRQESKSRQAAPRFARWFVLVVPIGMALIGLTIGDGRAAYQSSGGQVAVVSGMSMVALCWLWASRIMRLPEPQRVFDR